jgi:hypothetical protein
MAFRSLLLCTLTLVGCDDTAAPLETESAELLPLAGTNFVLRRLEELRSRLLFMNHQGDRLGPHGPSSQGRAVMIAQGDVTRISMTLPNVAGGSLRMRIGFRPESGRQWTFSTRFVSDGDGPKRAIARIRRQERTATGELLADDTLYETELFRAHRGYWNVNLGTPSRPDVNQVLFLEVSNGEGSLGGTVDLVGPTFAAKVDPLAGKAIVNYIDADTIRSLEAPHDAQLRTLASAGHRVWVLGGIRDVSQFNQVMGLIANHATLSQARFLLVMGGLATKATCDLAYFRRANEKTYDVPPLTIVTDDDASPLEPPDTALVRQNCAELTTPSLATDPRAAKLKSHLDMYIELARHPLVAGLYLPDELASLGLPVEYQHTIHQYVNAALPELMVFGTHSFYVGSSATRSDQFASEVASRYYSTASADTWFFDYYTAPAIAAGATRQQEAFLSFLSQRYFLAKPFVKLFYATVEKPQWPCSDPARYRNMLCASEGLRGAVPHHQRKNWSSRGFWAYFNAEARTKPPDWDATLAYQKNEFCQHQFDTVVQFSRAFRDGNTICP